MSETGSVTLARNATSLAQSPIRKPCCERSHSRTCPKLRVTWDFGARQKLLLNQFQVSIARASAAKRGWGPQPREPRERMAQFRRTIERFGRAAPGTTLVSITGAAPAGDYRRAFEIAVAEYRALAEFAAQHGVRVAIEPLNPILMNVDTFVCTLPDAMEIVDAVDHPSFGTFVDVWHIWPDAAAEKHITRSNLETTDAAIFDFTLAVNVRAPLHLIRAALPHFRKNGGGCVLNIGSINAYTGEANQLAYAISKGGLKRACPPTGPKKSRPPSRRRAAFWRPTKSRISPWRS